MRIEFKKLMEKLGVNRELSPYETHPWHYYDAEKGISCSAEVRIGPGGEDVEAEIQFLKETDDEESGSGIEQIMRLRAEPVVEKQWTVKELRVKGTDYANTIHDWETKGCDFFRACVESIQMSALPDIDELIEKKLNDDDGRGGGKSGRIGRKSPKIKPGALLGMKKPGGGM